MQLQIQVPSLMCEGCVDTLRKAILQKDDNATIEADLVSKTLLITSHLSEELVRSAIIEAGHTPVV